MAVAPEAKPEHTEAPGRGVAFEVDPRRTVPYRMLRFGFNVIMGTWFRPQITGAEQIPLTGPVILAPVHRSLADFGFTSFLTKRKLFFMAKDSLWKNKRLGQFLIYLGVFPVHRESADRSAMNNAEAVLARGEVLVLFPEGTRQEGPEVRDVLEGAAFLAARTGAVIIPVGIGNSDVAMPKGSRIPKPMRITVVVGAPIPAPERTGGGRVSRTKVHATTELLKVKVQEAYDEARI